MRIYIPATLDRLAAYVERGFVPGSNEYFIADDDSEDAEYAAMTAAALDAAELLDRSGRRVVLVADAVARGGDDGVVEVAMSDVLAVHVDLEDVDPSSDDLPELAWYATQEIPDLLA
ncbi:MAG TPA: hypothetical protein VFE15_11025 [Marmoricola sp.]|jgi:hypothetical protein|nr:hypothetical protein [Marmoricola sp.]